MKISLSWLSEWITFSADWSVISDTLTQSGIEIEHQEDNAYGGYIEIAILANIARCQSIRGLAVEMAMLGCGIYTPPKGEAVLPHTAGYPLAGSSLPPWCQRFSNLWVENVKIAPSPSWLQEKLLSMDIQPINNIVDLTQYLMWEWGQPLHAYDAEKLHAHPLGWRLSEKGEPVTLLHDTTPITLPEGIPLITAGTPAAIAGVIGLANTGVEEDTTAVVFELANFEGSLIRRPQQRLKCHTQAGWRFSRGVPASQIPHVVQRLLDLLPQVCPQATIRGYEDCHPHPQPTREISISRNTLHRALHLPLGDEEIFSLLSRLQLPLSRTNTSDDTLFTLTADDTRADLQNRCDLIEEVVRLHGYEHIPLLLPQASLQITHPTRHSQRQALREECQRLGLCETSSYHLTDPTLEAALLGGTKQLWLSVANPTSPKRSVMRRSLLPQLLQHAELALKTKDSVAFFEIGPVFEATKNGEALITPHIAWILAGTSSPLHAKAIAEKLLSRFFSEDYAITTTADPQVLWHPFSCAHIHSSKGLLGTVGTLQTEGAPHTYVGGYLDLTALSLTPIIHAYQPLSKTPNVNLDLSLSMPKTLPYEQLHRAIGNYELPFLVKVELITLFEPPEQDELNVLTLRLVFNDPIGSLTIAKTKASVDALVQALQQHLPVTQC